VKISVACLHHFVSCRGDHCDCDSPVVHPDSPAQLIGASEAISGVLGVFFICNPRARVTLVLDPVLIYFLRRFTFRLPAWVFLRCGFSAAFHGSNTVLPEPVRLLFDAVEITDYTLNLGDGFTEPSLAIRPAGSDARVEIGGPDGFALVFRQLAAVDIHLEGALEIRGAIFESLHWNSVGQVSHTEA